MLAAFIERIDNPSIIVRVGEGSTEHAKDYERSVYGEVIAPDEVILKGYDQPVDPEFFSTVMRTLYDGGFRTCHFDRLNHHPRTITIRLGPQGVLSMTVQRHEPEI